MRKKLTGIAAVVLLLAAGVRADQPNSDEALNIQDMTITGFLGGTSLLILVGVALDTARHMEQHLVMRHYDGFTKGRRISSRRGR